MRLALQEYLFNKKLTFVAGEKEKVLIFRKIEFIDVGQTAYS